MCVDVIGILATGFFWLIQRSEIDLFGLPIAVAGISNSRLVMIHQAGATSQATFIPVLLCGCADTHRMRRIVNDLS